MLCLFRCALCNGQSAAAPQREELAARHARRGSVRNHARLLRWSRRAGARSDPPPPPRRRRQRQSWRSAKERPGGTSSGAGDRPTRVAAGPVAAYRALLMGSGVCGGWASAAGAVGLERSLEEVESPRETSPPQPSCAASADQTSVNPTVPATVAEAGTGPGSILQSRPRRHHQARGTTAATRWATQLLGPALSLGSHRTGCSRPPTNTSAHPNQEKCKGPSSGPAPSRFAAWPWPRPRSCESGWLQRP
jgi:hypothetical protein